MGSWPFTRLHFGCSRCVAISGPHIQVLDAISGQIQCTARCTSNVSCSAVDDKYVHLVTIGDDKKLSVWELDRLALKSSRELPKKATAVQLTSDGQTILVADKFGDVFSYPLIPAVPAISRPSEPKQRDLQASHENLHGSLVLGHASIITSLILSHDGRHIITADRDEHIRVSRYPHGYIVDRYCLGHQSYVSAICIPTFEPSSLVSGGGDPSLNIWDWIRGTLKCQIPVLDTVRPFLRVRETKRKWHEVGGSSGARGRKGRRRGKKGKDTLGETTVTERPSSNAVIAESEGDPVFVLAKIGAFECKGEKLLLFSAVGGSALFYCTYPSQASEVPPVRYLDFSSPVLDFVLEHDCRFLVSLDLEWASPVDEEEPAKTLITQIEWQHGKFNIVDGNSLLLASLNSAGLQEASAAELASLNLYTELTLLPKHAEGPDDGEGSGGQDFDMGVDTPEGSQGDGKKQRAKVAGRLKTKQALLRRQELDQGSSRSISGDERESKRIKLIEND